MAPYEDSIPRELYLWHAAVDDLLDEGADPNVLSLPHASESLERPLHQMRSIWS